MALAASQFTKSRRRFLGENGFLAYGTFTGPASYTASGGDALSATVRKSVFFGMSQLEYIDFATAVKTDGSAAVFFAYDVTNAKLTAWTATAAGLVEVTNGTNLSTYVCRFVAVGD